MYKRCHLLLSLSLLCLSLMLSGCGKTEPLPEPDTPAVTVPAMPDGVVPGDEAAEPSPPADGLTGSYYNDYLGMTLSLDGSGACTLSGSGTDVSGTYTVSPDGLTLDFGAAQETAYCDEHGDITIEGRTGWFLRDWAFWGITEEEAGVPAAAVSTAGTETLDNGDGTMRYRDFTNHIAFTCTDTMQILPGRLYGAVAITDGNGAYVTGRNVTDALSAFSGDAEDFLKDYIKAEILSDFDALYGGHTAETDFLVSSDDTAGRLAAGTLRISNTDHDIAASVILYTSAYADGTENYICKTFFVPAAESSRQTDLAAAVTDMGAVRRK